MKLMSSFIWPDYEMKRVVLFFSFFVLVWSSLVKQWIYYGFFLLLFSCERFFLVWNDRFDFLEDLRVNFF